ncbi:hypothetical protein [Halostella pelagica]|uniref:hypothetical protein n=1 Tax=Halostella pelagica TaxID=2583824 RepID=UPI00108173A6|nr:hypothetical protein [Halostella pelagica]
MQDPADDEIARRANDADHFPVIENAAVTTVPAPRFQTECPECEGLIEFEPGDDRVKCYEGIGGCGAEFTVQGPPVVQLAREDR